MTKWEEFEEYLFDHAIALTAFDNKTVAADLGITRYEATQRIQNYLDAQTRENSKTLFVLSRDGRTSTAVWHVGARAVDVRGLGRQFSDDAKRRINRFVAPTLRRIGEKNPRALPAANAVGKAVEASVELLAAMLDDREA